MQPYTRGHLPVKRQDGPAPGEQPDRVTPQQPFSHVADRQFDRVILVIVDEQETAVLSLAQAHIRPVAQLEGRGAAHSERHLVEHIQVIQGIGGHCRAQQEYFSLAERLDEPGNLPFFIPGEDFVECASVRLQERDRDVMVLEGTDYCGGKGDPAGYSGDSQRLFQDGAFLVGKIFSAHPPGKGELASLADIIDQLLLDGGVALLFDHHPEQRRGGGIEPGAAELQCIEGSVGKGQPPGEEIEQDGVALVGDDMGGLLGSPGVHLGHELVQHETDGRHCLRLGEGQVLPVSVEHAGEHGVAVVMPAQRAVLADGVTPVVALHRAEQGVVLAVTEEVMVDGAHPRGEAQPGMQVEERGLAGAKVVVPSGLELDGEKRLLRVVQRLGHLVDRQQLVEVAFPDVPGIDVGGADHPVDLHDLHQLRDADGEGLAAVGEAVDVDHRRDLQSAGSCHFQQVLRIVVEIITEESAVIFHDPGCEGFLWIDDALAEEVLQITGRVAIG